VFKPFYVHFNMGPGKLNAAHPRGYTLRVSPDHLSNREVVVQGAWCNPKDEFNKSIGRQTADVAEQMTINKRKLPELCATMANKCFGYEEYDQMAYYYLLKFVV